MKLSIVSTLYRSAEYVAEFHRRASESARRLVGDDYEIVFVNDGSPDDSLDRAVALSDADPRVVVVDLSRNFGHHKAMMTGLKHARGEHVFLLDSDLEEEPEWLLPFERALVEKKADVVFGVQINRKGGWFERWSGSLFYKVMPILSGVDMPRDMVTARLMTRRYVDALLLHEEREIDIGGLWAITGFAQHAVPVTKHSTSETTYTVGRKLSLLVNSVTAFSNAPLVGIFWIGLAMFAVAFLVMATIVVQWWWLEAPVSGWASVIVSVWLLGSLIICFIGVLGIYISKMFSEVKRRPYSIVRAVHGRRPDTPAPSHGS
jgi:putative glycosyltransferase